MQRVEDLQTPALVVDLHTLDDNLRAMSHALPGPRLRPHVKAHKCTALAKRQADLGHRAFTCATILEMEGMARAGLGDDLLLANEVLDARRLGSLDARVTLLDLRPGQGPRQVQAQDPVELAQQRPALRGG